MREVDREVIGGDVINGADVDEFVVLGALGNAGRRELGLEKVLPEPVEEFLLVDMLLSKILELEPIDEFDTMKLVIGG